VAFVPKIPVTQTCHSALGEWQNVD